MSFRSHLFGMDKIFLCWLPIEFSSGRFSFIYYIFNIVIKRMSISFLTCRGLRNTLIIGNKNIYGLWVGIWTFSRIFGLLWNEGFGVAPWGIPSQCHLMDLIIRNNNIYGLGVGFWTISEILGLLWSEGNEASHWGTPVSVSGLVLS